MNRVYVQVKRIVNNIDFNKISEKLNKQLFLIKKNNYLYGLEKEILSIESNLIIVDDKTYIIYEVKETDSIKDIVIGVVLKMNDYQQIKGEYNKEKLLFLSMQKTNDYYIKKYQQSLLMVKALKLDKTIYNDCYNIMNKRNNDDLVSLEMKLESVVGFRKYLELKLLEMFKYEEYQFNMRTIFETLEDPLKLLNYINNIENFSAAYLLVNSILKQVNTKNVDLELDKPLFSFEKLMLENDRKVKKLLMYKMINARKFSHQGKIINCNFSKTKVSDNLYYFPDEIIIYNNYKTIVKKGDFILKLNSDFEIEEGYECFSIDKILA